MSAVAAVRSAAGDRPRRSTGCPRSSVFVLGIVALAGRWSRRFDVQQFLLPEADRRSPSTFWDERGTLWARGLVYTFKEALGGFALGSGLGILVALVLARLRAARHARSCRSRSPRTRSRSSPSRRSRTTGSACSNPFSKMAIAAVLCFFPVLVNTLRGLTSVRPARDRADALLRGGRARRSSGASASRPRCRIMFAGLKIASVLAMIGAIVGEYFGGPTTALGVHDPERARATSNFAVAWAGIVRRQRVRDRSSTARSRSPSG